MKTILIHKVDEQYFLNEFSDDKDLKIYIDFLNFEYNTSLKLIFCGQVNS